MNRNPDDTPGYVSLKIIDEIPPFQSPIEFEFDPEVNVFIGPNATGKSTILKLLCQEFLDNDYHDEWVPGALAAGVVGAPHNVDSNRFAIKGGPRRYWERPPEIHLPPQIYLPPVRDVAPVAPSKYGQTGPEDVSDDFLQGLVYVAVLKVIAGDAEIGIAEIGNADLNEVRSTIKRCVQKVIDRARQGLEPIYIIGKEEFLETLRSLSRDDKQGRADANAVEDAVHEKEVVAETRRQLQAVPGGRFLLNGVDPYTSFPAVRVKLALDRLRQDDPDRYERVMNVAADCCYDICPEVFTGEVDTYRDQEYRGRLVVSETAHPGEGLVLRGPAGNETVYIGQLSTGTQGLWWWICWLALKLAYRRPRYRFKQPAILLIDEIENHLHPTWQRRVIPALRKHFPQLQIFATTHSPFVVAGLKRGQVHRLYREKGVIKTDKLTEEEKEHKLVGWTVEEILQEFMDVEDPTDEETAMAAATLRWLRRRQPPPDVSASNWVGKCIEQIWGNHERLLGEEQALRWLSENQPDSQSSATAKEWWLATIERLRSAIGPDLEAGGPIAAQTDRFLEEIERIASEYGIKEEADEEDS